MPRHPPIALKTLDRSHCQCPPAQSRRDCRFSLPLARLASAQSQRNCRLNRILCGIQFDVIGTKRPASRDRFEGAVRQTHHMQGIERPLRQITNLSAHEVRTNLLFTMSNRTSGKPRSSPQTFLRMTFFHLYSTPLPRSASDNPSDAQVVEPDGIEPTTSCLQSRRSPS